ncbi:3206_t:CDS:2 [Funneliformis geosporum]|uniref:7123_t:CDS:1 n=1 Tax=Funneliformis geosporum TaxID=1117311 RepID=A0A9W4SUZ1_9GLOM|nr:3206_t:CDS:2 [Funneliformis geosporum]CAI2180072.1 7123_t:CDS:2 [Funneliformis geosporum]
MNATNGRGYTFPFFINSISPSQAFSTWHPVDSTTSYYSPAMDMHPKDMPETAFVIAFCVKFRSAINNISFWPEDLDEAICCKEGPNTLIESLLKAFVQNLDPRRAKIPWVKRLAKIINDWQARGYDTFFDYNPIERSNYDYYKMSNREKVLLMQVLVSWQLADSAVIKRIRKEHKEIVNDDDFRPLEVEVIGEDTSGSRYYYMGTGTRIYRESMISGRVKWETLSNTVDELKKFIFDYQGLDPNRSERERILYHRLINDVLPLLEPLEIERQKFKEIVINNSKADRDREFRLKKIEKDHNDSEILLVRTRSQAKQSTHNEVKNTTGYLEIINKPFDPFINSNIFICPKFRFLENVVDDVMDYTSSCNVQAERNIFEKNSIDSRINGTKDEGDVIVVKTINGDTGTSASKTISIRSDKCPIKNERKKIAVSRCREGSNSKMNISSILTDVTKEAESVEKRSELSKMAISNILSNETPDIFQNNDVYPDESDGNNQHGPMPFQYGNGSVESYEFDIIAQESNNNDVSQENEMYVPIAKEQNDMVERINTPNDIEDTIRNLCEDKETAEVNDGVQNESNRKRAFVPNAETMMKLEWSLNHPVFKLDEDIFGESTDTDLSDCCSNCAMEVN